MALAEHDPSKVSAKNKSVLDMGKSSLHDFAATKRKGLPQYAPKKKKGFSL